MNNIEKTQSYEKTPAPSLTAKEVLEQVYAALKQKGYDPVNQFVGYIMSGDPSYITAYHGARNLITKVEREELVEEIMQAYMDNEKERKKYRYLLK